METYGEASALLSAGFWAASSFIFQKNMSFFTPMMLNLLKAMISLIVIIVLLLALGISFFPTLMLAPYLTLALSGVFGIAIGDTLYFNALSELGPSKTLLLETLASPFTGIIAYLFYGTSLSFFGWMGIAATMIGLYIVVTDSHNQEEKILQVSSPPPLLIPLVTFDLESNMNSPKRLVGLCSTQIRRKSIFEPRSSTSIENVQAKIKHIFTSGLVNGIISMFCQSLGMVLSHNALQQGVFNSLTATFYRILASIAVLIPIIKLWKKESISWPKQSISQNALLLVGILFGNVISVWLQQISLEYTRPEISQTLLATSPLFALVFSRIKGEHVSMKALIGSLIAVSGVGVIVWL